MGRDSTYVGRVVNERVEEISLLRDGFLPEKLKPAARLSLVRHYIENDNSCPRSYLDSWDSMAENHEKMQNSGL
jgi:hypothetical protein